MVPCTDNYNFVKSLGDPAVVREWRINGLPSDDFSAENGIIATKGERYPLMIDPQNQASGWTLRTTRVGSAVCSITAARN